MTTDNIRYQAQRSPDSRLYQIERYRGSSRVEIVQNELPPAIAHRLANHLNWAYRAGQLAEARARLHDHQQQLPKAT